MSQQSKLRVKDQTAFLCSLILIGFYLKKNTSSMTVRGAFNSVPSDKSLDWSKLKAFADNEIKVTEKLNLFSPPPTTFSKSLSDLTDFPLAGFSPEVDL